MDTNQIQISGPSAVSTFELHLYDDLPIRYEIFGEYHGEPIGQCTKYEKVMCYDMVSYIRDTINDNKNKTKSFHLFIEEYADSCDVMRQPDDKHSNEYLTRLNVEFCGMKRDDLIVHQTDIRLKGVLGLLEEMVVELQSAFSVDLRRHGSWSTLIRNLVQCFTEYADFPSSFRSKFPACARRLQELRPDTWYQDQCVYHRNTVYSGTTGIRIPIIAMDILQLNPQLQRHIRSKMRHITEFVAGGMYILTKDGYAEDNFGQMSIFDYNTTYYYDLMTIAGSVLMELSIIFRSIRPFDIDKSRESKNVMMYVGTSHRAHLVALCDILFGGYMKNVLTFGADNEFDRCILYKK
jgi:hypothetical protein